MVGLPPTAYVIQKNRTDKDDWEDVDTVDHLTVNCKIPHLTEGKDYYLRICARNEIGDGPYATTDRAIKAERPPGGYYRTFV